MSIRIFVAEDRELIRAGVREFVRGTDIHIVGEASLNESAKVDEGRVDSDVVLLGLEPPGNEGLELIKQWQAGSNTTKAVIYAARKSAELIAKAIANGAAGLLSHDASRDAFLEGLKSVVAGEPLWSREDLRRAGAASRLTDAGSDVQLTRREHDVIAKMLDGLTNKQIAQQLDISYETVKEHVQHILRKVGVSDRTQAAVWAVRNRIG